MKPTLLDLYCCAGGAARGYQLAGFDVTGVDVRRQPRYAGDRFIQADVLSLSPSFLASFSAIHASPPCQFATALKHMHNAKPHLNLIPQTRELLQRSGLPYIIENVEEAREHLVSPILLCGSMFGLSAEGAQLQRHRLFESNVPISAPSPCRHDPERPVLGVYGGHARIRSAKFGGRKTRDPWPNGHQPVMAEAMEMPWANTREISEAIPPAFTEHIGFQLRAVLTAHHRTAA